MSERSLYRHVYMIIIPSILVFSKKEFKKQIKTAENTVAMIQIDLSDGAFTPRATWAYLKPKPARKYLKKIDFELHLMVTDPLKIIKDWADHPRLKRVLFHYETAADPVALAAEIKAKNLAVGLVLSPETDLNLIRPSVDQFNLIMLMGVRPGAQGQEFIPQTIERIKQIRASFRTILISVDGGVNEKTILPIVQAGADIVCPGSAVFGNDRSPAENISRLKKLINLTDKT